MTQESELLSQIPPAPRTPTDLVNTHMLGWQGSRRVMLIVGLVAFVIGGIATYATCSGATHDMMISFSEATTQGTLNTVEEDKDGMSRRLRRGLSADIEYAVNIDFAYTVDGIPRKGQIAVFADEMDPPPTPGAEVTVEYSTWNPDVARIKGTDLNPAGFLSWVMPCFVLFGLLLIPLVLIERTMTARTFKKGDPVMARVTAFGKSETAKYKGQPMTVVNYAFEIADKTYEGKFDHHDPEFMKRFDQEQIPVLYDADDPSNNLPWLDR